MLPVIRLQAVRVATVEHGFDRGDSSQKAADLARRLFKEDADREYLVVCCLDVGLKPLSMEVVAIGTLDQCLANPREIFKNAILSNSANIILFHNHSSGDTRPSPDDDRLTQRLKSAGELLGIPLLDHVIIGSNSMYSLRDGRTRGRFPVRYYIAIRKKVVTDGEVRQVVKLPGNMKETVE